MPVVRAYSWTPTRQPIAGINSFTIVNPTQAGTADSHAARVAAEQGPRAVEDRGLLIFVPVGYTFDQHVTRRTIKPFLTQTVDTSRTRSWYLQFFTGLRNRNVPLSVIAMDEESNVSNWAFENYGAKDAGLPAYLHALWADTQVQSAMPANLRAYSMEMILQKNVPAVNAFNSWTADIVRKMIRSLVVDTYAAVFGSIPIVSNYGDMRGTFPLFDANGWQGVETQVSGWSSPSCYVTWPGPRYGKGQGRVLDPHWNCFLDCINFVRSPMAFNAQCIPWVSYRSFVEPNGVAPKPSQWLWNQLLFHAIATGVDRLLFWNPKHDNAAADADDRALGDFIAAAAQLPRVVRQLPPLALDSPSVTTGAFTTDYSTYANAANIDLSMPAPRAANQFRPPVRTPIRQFAR